MMLMFCAFEGQPLSLRTYGEAAVIHASDTDAMIAMRCFQTFLARNIYKLDSDLATTSCGTGDPEMFSARSPRETEQEPRYGQMEPAALGSFWQKKNLVSLDQ